MPAPFPIRLITVPATFVAAGYFVRQCRKPSGPLGRFVLWTMNQSHASLTTWGLRDARIGESHAILDVGCGGGRTVERLSALAPAGKVRGVDYSAASVAASRKHNRSAIDAGRVEIQEASVSHLPFAEDTFDLVTAIETHYYWPDRAGAFREILRVLKPGGMLLIVAEAYRGSWLGWLESGAMKWIGGETLTVEEHRNLFACAGYGDVKVLTEPAKGWICAYGRKIGDFSQCLPLH